MRWLCFVLFLLIAVPVQAQFALGLGAVQSDEGHAIAVDDAGNVYITGYFNGTVDFDPGPGTLELTADGSEATFVASYDAAGALRYAFDVQRNSGSPLFGIAVDDDGNVYITGSFLGAGVDFDPGSQEMLLNSADGRIYVASYGPTGSLRFAFNVGGGRPNFLEGGSGIVLDPAGNVYVTGVFNDDDDLDPSGGGDVLEVSGNTDAFVAGYTSDGGFRFAFPIGGTGGDVGYGIAADASGCYVTGSYQGSADFDPGPEDHTFTSEGGEDLYVASYDATGGYRFAFATGSMSSGIGDRGTGIAVDAAGNVFVTGFFGGTNSTIDFEPGPGQTILNSETNADLFLASYTPTGGLRFAFDLGNSSGVQSRAVTIDDMGGVHITGVFSGAMDFDPGPADRIVGENGSHAFVASYTNDGRYRNAYAFGPLAGGSASGNGIAVDVAGTPHIIGAFTDAEDFDPGPGEVILTSNGSGDVFVTNYATVAVAGTPGPQTGTLALGLPTPNPSRGSVRLGLTVGEAQHVRAELVDALGRRVAVLFDGPSLGHSDHALAFDAAGLPTGLYVVRVTGETGTVHRRIVIAR